jgi:hypothetical protein
MTRKDQFSIFLPFFEAEEKRYAALTQRATTFLGLTSIIVLFGGLDAAKIPHGSLAFFFALATGLCVLLAVLGSIASLWIRTYKDICDVEEFVVTIEEQGYSEEDIYSTLLAGMAAAIQHNREINTKRANWLQFAATFFSLAIIFAAITSLATSHERANPATTAEQLL